VLVELGADVNAKDKVGWTPLHLASHRGQESVVRFLEERGAE
jgi:ankyrin repeat protein